MSERVSMRAPGISCEHCARTIKRELEPVEGVEAVAVDVPTKTIEFDVTDDASLSRARALLVEIGYPPA